MAGPRRAAIHIGIVDDHPVFRLGLKRALERESDLEITWEIGSFAQIEPMMRESPVDVLLMDVYLGHGKDGLAATREVTERWPDVTVAVMSASLDPRVGAASTRAGAAAFLSKSVPVTDMVSAIRKVAALNASKRGKSSKARPGRPAGERLDGLSPRERQVLEHLRLGRTNREIAAEIGISIATVNKHVHAVLTALKVRNRTQAAQHSR